MVKVSIIIPIYNSHSYINRCIDSVLNQSFKNFELILINDGSIDNSLDIIKLYKDKRIKIVNQKNMGVAKTRNKGINLATGNYIIFVDNDDYLDVEYISNFINNIGDNDIIVSGYKRTNTSGKMIYEKKLKNVAWSKYENMAPWAKMIKTSYIKKSKAHFFDYNLGEDIIFNMILYSNTKKIKVVNYNNYNWFYNDKSVSNTNQKKFNKDITILLDEMKKYNLNDETNYYLNRYWIWYLLFCGKCETSSNFIKEYDIINNWIKKNKINNNLTMKNIIKNESSLKNSIALILFKLFIKINKVNFFSKIYCSR